LKKIGLFERWSLDDLRKGFFVRCLAEGKDTSEICYLLGIKNKQFNSLRKIISLNEQVSKKDRDFILKRDNYTCQKCGMIEEEHKTLFNQVLLVHHIDFNKLNNNPNNIIRMGWKEHWQTHYNQASLMHKNEAYRKRLQMGGKNIGLTLSIEKNTQSIFLKEILKIGKILPIERKWLHS